MKNRALTQSCLAVAALITGVLVYVLDRPAGSTRFLPESVEIANAGGGYFGALGANLPSFLHVYAFILLTAVVLRPGKRGLFMLCIAWFCIDLVFELQQYAAQCCADTFANTPLLFAAGGSFDPWDIAALAFGALAAFATAVLTQGRLHS